jgi:hypothetical protein
MSAHSGLIKARSCINNGTFQYLSPKKYGEINALIRLVLRNLGGETYISAEQWIERFKFVSVKLIDDTGFSDQVPGSGVSGLNCVGHRIKKRSQTV